MPRYSQEFKYSIIKKMMPPENKSVAAISQETGLSEATLFKWKKEAKTKGFVITDGESSSEDWSSQDKFQIVLETAVLNEAELAEYCRKKGLYVEQIEAWRNACQNANGGVAQEAALAQGISLNQTPLVLHWDNGSPMKGATLLETLYKLGIKPSRSRPRVSNDNPYAESIFRTCKYRPGFPAKGFQDLPEARSWVLQFERWYNYQHKHSGIAFLTPHQRHTGQEDILLAKRRETYEKAKRQNPNRWSRHTRNWSIAKEVWLNPVSERSTTAQQTIN